ncbi:hypothetical protein CGLO_10009 [Colletotrichum gloeosporioides Cg-14]|uniref:Uncharacterized protein n=1 Tax=Colletotrichum gloeosporioides (strain Cg-14) TaxID=1237896 RepID=T0K509_COLGC|nr:hypothetical protein CGLO_10009 [Colletotrichum gloeosporioides Cg-14]
MAARYRASSSAWRKNLGPGVSTLATRILGLWCSVDVEEPRLVTRAGGGYAADTDLAEDKEEAQFALQIAGSKDLRASDGSRAASTVVQNSSAPTRARGLVHQDSSLPTLSYQKR